MHKHADFEISGFGEFAAAPAPHRDYARAALALGPVAHWRLGDAAGPGAEAADLTGAHPGQVLGGVSAGPGAIARDPEGGAVFDGDSGRIVVPHAEELTIFGDLTLTGWLKVGTDLVDASGIFLTAKADAEERIAYLLEVRSGPLLRLYHQTAEGSYISVQSGVFTADHWHHFAVVRDTAGGRSRVFIDGEPGGWAATASPGGSPPTGALVIGRRVGDAYRGALDELAVFDRALNESEVAQLYHRGRGRLLPEPAGVEVGAALSQSAGAGFPDRGAVGLAASLSPGGGGACLVHALPAPEPSIHTRFMLGPLAEDPLTAPGAEGGSVVLAGGQAASGDAAWWLVYHVGPGGEAASVTAHSAGSGATLTAALPAYPPWHHVELGVEGPGGGAALRVDGRVADRLAAGFDAPGAAAVWLGAMDKTRALRGGIALDEWAIAESPIGPARPEPRSAYAEDPARWLVVYNTADPDAPAWAEHYRAARSIPYANLLGLDLPPAETISEAQYQALRGELEAYLADNALGAVIVGFVLGYRVPGFVADSGDAGPRAVATRLQCADPDPPGTGNPMARDGDAARPTASDWARAGRRLASRIDGPDPAAAHALIQRGGDLLARPLDAAAGAGFYLDAFPDPGPETAAVTDRWVEYARSLERQRLRLPFFAAGDLTPAGEGDPPGGPRPRADFASVRGEALSVAWSDPAPPAGYFAPASGPDAPAARRALAVSLEVEAGANTTLRDPAPTQWARAALAGGYAAAVAASRPGSLSDSPYPRPLWAALGQGWTLGEAWGLCQPNRAGGFFLVGDPLVRLTMPRAGYDVLGPMDRLDAVDPAAPRAALPATADAFFVPPEARPAAGESGVYALSVLDRHGRAERAYPSARIVVDEAGRPTPAPPAPLWPDHPGWPATVSGGSLVARAWWGRPLGRTALAGVRLEAQSPNDHAVTIAAEPTLDPGRRRVTVTLPIPAGGTRYRWALRTTGPWTFGPWSAPTAGAQAPTRALRAV